MQLARVTLLEYVTPLRKEIESIVASEGWTKTSVDKMYKLDSFLKESIRMFPLGYGSLLYGDFH